MIDVVIPCRNEADTVPAVVQAFLAVDYIGTVHVAVDADTTDDTVTLLMKHPRPPRLHVHNTGVRGKGENIGTVIDCVDTATVIFCDGDLTGLTPDHIRGFTCPCPWMTIGVIDYPQLSPVPWVVPMDTWAMMSGERCLPTDLARRIPWHGYTVEAFLNREADRTGVEIHFKRLAGVSGKARNNAVRMTELRRDREWLAKNW